MLAYIEKFKIKSEWFLEYSDGHRLGPFLNLVPQVGLNWLAQRIVDGDALYLAIGTSTTPATISDIKLGTEGFRKAVTSKTRSNAMTRLRTFLSTTEGNGNWQEMGIFANATDVVDSGTMLNHLVQSFSKTTNTSLTIECRITVGV